MPSDEFRISRSAWFGGCSVLWLGRERGVAAAVEIQRDDLRQAVTADVEDLRGPANSSMSAICCSFILNNSA